MTDDNQDGLRAVAQAVASRSPAPGAALAAPAAHTTPPGTMKSFAAEVDALYEENVRIYTLLEASHVINQQAQARVGTLEAQLAQANETNRTQHERFTAELEKTRRERDVARGQFTELRAGLAQVKAAVCAADELAETNGLGGAYTGDKRRQLPAAETRGLSWSGGAAPSLDGHAGGNGGITDTHLEPMRAS